MTRKAFKGAMAGVASMLLGSQAFAQAQGNVPAGLSSPSYTTTDPNGINLTSNKPTFNIVDVAIGEKKNSLSHNFMSTYEPNNQQILFTDSFAGKIQSANVADPSSCPSTGSTAMEVIIGGQGDTMCSTTVNVWYPMRKGGTSMVRNADGTLTYTNNEGSQFHFGLINGTYQGLLTQVTNPDGRITTFTYKFQTRSGGATYRRLQSVTRNDGLQMKYTYVENTLPATGYPQNWLRISTVTAINNTVDYCDPAADSCTYSQAWPTATHVWTATSPKYFTITDAGGQSTRLTIGIPVLTPGEAPGVPFGTGWTNYTGDQLLAVRSPTSTSADNIVYKFCAVWGEYYCMKLGVKKVVAGGQDWLYPGTSGSGGPSIFIQLTVDRPASVGGGWVTTTQSGNNASGPMISHIDGLSKKTYAFEYGHANRVASVQSVEGDIINYVYDQRGNITQETHTPKSGSTLAPIVKTANFDTTCTNPKTCNRPNWVTDGRLKQTDFAYDPDHGGLTKVTSPPDANGVRGVVRNTYVQRYAWYKNASGTLVQAATPIWLLSTKKVCRKTATLADGSGCSGANDEVVTTYEYGPTSGANNLYTRGMAVTADGVTLRACYANDIYGNRIGETLPKAGLTSCP